MNKLFSIVTVCYNSVKTIEQTFNSLLGQTYINYEYIVVDGGSTDGTLDIIKKYEAKFGSKMKWISERDNGIYDAMNKGIDMASGELIAFLNSDDYYEKDALCKLNEFYKINKNVDFIYGNTILVYNFDNTVITKLDIPINKITKKTLNAGMGFIHQSCFVKKSIFKKVGKFNTYFKIGADWDFVIRCYNSNVKFSKINTTISYFSKDGISSKSHVLERHKIRKFNELYNVIDLYLFKDITSAANIINLLSSEENYMKLRKLYHKYLNR